MARTLFSGKDKRHAARVAFANCIFMPDQNILQVDDVEHQLENKQSLVLLFLLANAASTVSKERLLDFAWKNRTVGDDVLTVAVSHLRKILRDSARSPVFIKTITGEGYQFVGAVSKDAKALALRLVDPVNETQAEEMVDPVKTSKPLLAGIVMLGVVCLLGILYMSMPESKPEINEADDWQVAASLLQSSTREELQLALEQYEQLNTQYPDDARGYVGIAQAQFDILRFQPLLRYEAGGELRDLLNKAIALAPKNTAAHALRAEIEFRIFWEFDVAEEYYQKALRFEPENFQNYMAYSQFQLALGNFDKASEALNRSRELNPRLYAIPSAAWINNMQRKYPEAIVELEKLLAVRPDTFSYHVSAQSIYENMGENVRSYSHLKRVLELREYDEPDLGQVDAIFEKEGLKGVYRWLAFEKNEQRYIGQYLPPLSHARYAVKANEIEAALTYLEESLKKRQTALLWLNVDPKYDPLRKEPRFQAIVEALGLPLKKT